MPTGYLKDDYTAQRLDDNINDFQELDRLIKEQNFTKKQVEAVCLEILNQDELDLSELDLSELGLSELSFTELGFTELGFTELHNEIKRLIDTGKIGIMHILEFYDDIEKLYLEESIKLINEANFIKPEMKRTIIWYLNHLMKIMLCVDLKWESIRKVFTIDKNTMSSKEVYEKVQQFVFITADGQFIETWLGFPINDSHY